MKSNYCCLIPPRREDLKCDGCGECGMKGATNFKEIPWRSGKYLAHVRTLDCVDCGWPSNISKGIIEAHHIRTGGVSTKCPDNETVPLCNKKGRNCHGKADKSPHSAGKYAPTALRIFEEWQARQ